MVSAAMIVVWVLFVTKAERSLRGICLRGDTSTGSATLCKVSFTSPEMVGRLKQFWDSRSKLRSPAGSA